MKQERIGWENPYPETIIDEASGLEFPNDKHRVYNEGYFAALMWINKKLKELSKT